MMRTEEKKGVGLKEERGGAGVTGSCRRRLQKRFFFRWPKISQEAVDEGGGSKKFALGVIGPFMEAEGGGDSRKEGEEEEGAFCPKRVK